MVASSENRVVWRVPQATAAGSERDGIAELFKPMDGVALESRGVQMGEVVRAEVDVGLVVAAHVGDGDDQGVGDGDDRLQLATAVGKAVVPGGEIGIRGVRDRPGDFAQDGLEPGIAVVRLAAERLSRWWTRRSDVSRGRAGSMARVTRCH